MDVIINKINSINVKGRDRKRGREEIELEESNELKIKNVLLRKDLTKRM